MARERMCGQCSTVYSPGFAYESICPDCGSDDFTYTDSPTQADDGGERERVEKRINGFGALLQDWDTYGAPPIPGTVMLLALDLVGFLEGTKLEITGASPTNDEAILLDTKNGMGIEVSAHGN